MSVWVVFVAIGLSTWGLRSVFLLREGRTSSERFDALRRYVPVVALTALIVPSLVPRDGEPVWARGLAAAAAAGVAWRSKNVLATVVVGLVLFWWFARNGP